MALTESQSDYLDGLVRSGYMPTIEQWAKRATAAIWWTGGSSAPPSSTRGGTVCFAHTGERILGITAEHIHSEVVTRLNDDPSVHCQVGGHTFDPRTRIIDADKELDIATYDFTEVSANAANVDVHHPTEWPPRAHDQTIGIVGGWPWTLTELKESKVDLSFLHFVCLLQADSNTQIGASTFTSTSVAWGNNQLPAGTNLGGMSGGPIYQLVPDPIEHLQLVGIIYEYSPSFELVLARPLTFVRKDGTIIRRGDDV